MTNQKKLYVIDGTAMLYRSHFAMINNPLTDKDGFITSGIFGFIATIVRLLKSDKPDYLAVVFDAKEKTFRHEIYTEYKATREKMPDELAAQIEPLDEIIRALNAPILRMSGYEADDIMGTLALKAEQFGLHTYLVTGDKDMMQLVSDHVSVYVPALRRNPTKIYDREAVIEKFGLPPEQIVDYLGLMGDASDNVPGVAGVGQKTAKKLLDQYGSLEETLNRASEVANKRAREGLEQGREMALLSKELVTIDCHVPIEIDLEELRVERLTPTPAAEKLKEFDIRTLSDDLLTIGGEAAPLEMDQPDKDYQLVQNSRELDDLEQAIRAADWVSFDLETTSLAAVEADIVGISFSIAEHTGWYIPVMFPERNDKTALSLDTILAAVGPLLEDEAIPKIGQNIKYDALVMRRYDIQVKGIVFDTLIAAHLLNPGDSTYKLDHLSEVHLNYRMVPIEDLIGKRGKNQLSMADVPLATIAHYATEDADVVGQLYPPFLASLVEQSLAEYIQKVELPLIPVLVEMEHQGVYLDLDFLAEMSRDLGNKMEQFQEQILAAAGEEFNMNSPQQLGVILFDKLGLPQIRKRSTDVNVLQMLKDKHELPALILDYRQVKKLKSTYVDAFPELVNQATGRVHSSFNQTVAATGRLSSTNPNFQNIPIRTDIGREIRKAFRPQEEGWVIYSADYSQIELRIMADLSGETELIRSFSEGVDVHSQTAATVFDVPVGMVTDDMRRTAKVVNYGIMYGAGPFRMSQELNIPLQQGRELVNRYYNTYPGLRLFVDQLLAEAKEKGYVQTLMGRRRKVPGLNSSNGRVRQSEERIAVNTPIQGTAAELIKLAMINIQERLSKTSLKARMILQIHDELLFEVPENEVEELSKIVEPEMVNAMSFKVPLEVESGFGSSWYEAH
ncbi:DNA polymerase I [Candidatus Neomarinimicrobiota bacterium]